MSASKGKRWDHSRTTRIVLTGLWADAVLVMAASAYNGGQAFDGLGQPFAAGIALGVAVDVGLAVGLVGDRALHLAGRQSRWGRALRVATAFMSLALNCAVALWLGHYGVAVFHAFLPILLVLLSEYAQDSTLQFGEIADEHAAEVRAELDAEAARQRAIDDEARAVRDAERRERDAETRRIREAQAEEQKRLADERAAARQRADEIALAQAHKEAAEAQAAADRERAEADRSETEKLAQKAEVLAARGPRSRTGRTGGAGRNGKADRTSRTAAPPDVTDLLPAGRAVADRLATAGKPLTRSALLAGLRSDEVSCSTDRAAALLDLLKAERSEQGSEHRSEPDRAAVHSRTDRPLHAVAGGGH